METKHGLCSECQSEIYVASYGAAPYIKINVNRMSPKEVAKAIRENDKTTKTANTDYKRLAKEARCRCAIVADYFDDFGGGQINFLLCERHLEEALRDVRDCQEMLE